VEEVKKIIKKVLTNKTKYAIMNTSNEGDVKNV
jgi:alpha-galactosidase/6-phospho-beta-glucosidase family protein